jgi:hypothetical protein
MMVQYGPEPAERSIRELSVITDADLVAGIRIDGGSLIGALPDPQPRPSWAHSHEGACPGSVQTGGPSDSRDHNKKG